MPVVLEIMHPTDDDELLATEICEFVPRIGERITLVDRQSDRISIDSYEVTMLDYEVRTGQKMVPCDRVMVFVKPLSASEKQPKEPEE